MAYNSTEQLTNLDTEDYILITMYGIIFFVGVFGIATVIYVFKFKYGETLTTVQTQIFYLAVSDLFGSIINPFHFYSSIGKLPRIKNGTLEALVVRYYLA